MAEIVPPGPAVTSLMTTAEVAEMIRQSTRTVRRHRAAGRLRAITLGPCTTLYDRAEVERFIASATTNAAEGNRGARDSSAGGDGRHDEG